MLALFSKFSFTRAMDFTAIQGFDALHGGFVDGLEQIRAHRQERSDSMAHAYHGLVVDYNALADRHNALLAALRHSERELASSREMLSHVNRNSTAYMSQLIEALSNAGVEVPKRVF